MNLEHVALYVQDLERMRQFYCEELGATAGTKYHNPISGFQSYFLQFDSGPRIEIMYYPATSMSKPVNEESRNRKSLGYAHLAFRLGSREAVDLQTRFLSEKGVKVLSQPRLTGDGYYESVILDPEGNQIELCA